MECDCIKKLEDKMLNDENGGVRQLMKEQKKTLEKVEFEGKSFIVTKDSMELVLTHTMLLTVKENKLPIKKKNHDQLLPLLRQKSHARTEIRTQTHGASMNRRTTSQIEFNPMDAYNVLNLALGLGLSEDSVHESHGENVEEAISEHFYVQITSDFVTNLFQGLLVMIFLAQSPLSDEVFQGFGIKQSGGLLEAILKIKGGSGLAEPAWYNPTIKEQV